MPKPVNIHDAQDRTLYLKALPPDPTWANGVTARDSDQDKWSYWASVPAGQYAVYAQAGGSPANTDEFVYQVIVKDLDVDWADGGRLDLLLDALTTELAKVPRVGQTHRWTQQEVVTAGQVVDVTIAEEP